MSVVLGNGGYRYRVEEGWDTLPKRWPFHGRRGEKHNDSCEAQHDTMGITKGNAHAL